MTTFLLKIEQILISKIRNTLYLQNIKYIAYITCFKMKVQCTNDNINH